MAFSSLRRERPRRESNGMPNRRSRLARKLVASTCATLTTLLLLAGTAAARSPVTVSLTFDDGHADQYPVRQMLAARGMHATFFINSGFVGRSDRLSWGQIDSLYADGNEIGGHSIDHARLPDLSPEAMKWEVCDDRAALMAHGYPVTSFAYPFAFHTLDTDPIVAACGYNSARGIGGIVSPGYCPYCDFAEGIPPAYPMYTLAPQAVVTGTSLETLQGYVTQAEDHGGGWVQLVFHHVCDACDEYSVTPDRLTTFLDWLAERAAAGTQVKTVAQVVGGDVKPVVRGDTQAPVSASSCDGGTCSSGWYRDRVSVSLTAVDSGGSGLSSIRYTTDGSEPTTASAAYVAPLTLTATTSLRWRALDRQGNAEVARSQPLNVDSTVPSVAISYPRAGAKLRGTVALTASATDSGSGVRSVSYRLDGRLIGTSTDAASAWRFAWATRGSSGRHLLSAVATDRVGHAATSASVAVSVH